VFTRHEPLSPARVLADAYVDAAVLSPGSVVAGDVTRSIVSTRCRVGANAVVHDSVLLPGAVVGDGCVLDKVVVDCDAVIPTNTRLGARLGAHEGFYASPEGIVLATAARPAPPFDTAARAIA
jgi:glucose-1-phosphate adenylyltransferase